MSDRKLKILIADDEPLMRGLLCSYLVEECKYEVYKASDGKEALQLYVQYREELDMIFLDIEMPKVNGLRVLKEIHTLDPNAYVVIVSGVGNLDNVKAAIAAGVNGFIVKPFTNNKIAEAIGNYLKRKKP